MIRNAANAEGDNTIEGIRGYAARSAAKRKLAVGRAILDEGPVTGTRILAATRACGVPSESAAYPNTLRQVGFLAQVPGRPIRWRLTEKGEAWTRAMTAGEAAAAEAASC
jgi:hypothetical protein